MSDVDITQITIQSYDNTAAAYCDNTLLMDISNQILKFSSYLQKGALILDSGCGPGRDAKKFSDAGFNVIGIDLSSKLLDYAKSYAPKAEFLIMDLNHLNFPDNKFDGIWAMASLLHIKKSEFPSALLEHYRVLKTGGPFYLSLKRGNGERLEPDARYGNVNKFFAYYTDNEILKILKDIPFKINDFKSINVESEYATHPWMDIYLQKQ